MVPGKDILPETSVLLICDVQEKFRPHALHFESLVEVIRRLVSRPKIKKFLKPVNFLSVFKLVSRYLICLSLGFYEDRKICKPKFSFD